MSFRKISIYLTVIVAAFLFASGCGEKKDDSQNNNTGSQNGSQQQQNREVQANNNTALSANTMVREGEIDLKAIDKNNDGKVFECQMDYNVISDTKGTCPKCGMNLDEISLDEAKRNLTANGYKVK